MKLLAQFRSSPDAGSGSIPEYRGESNHFYECRDCGGKYAEKPPECPACESTEIAFYRFS